jgi:hypothetical protein
MSDYEFTKEEQDEAAKKTVTIKVATLFQMLKIIDVAHQRGLFKASEMSYIGSIYDTINERVEKALIAVRTNGNGNDNQRIHSQELPPPITLSNRESETNMEQMLERQKMERMNQNNQQQVQQQQQQQVPQYQPMNNQPMPINNQPMPMNNQPMPINNQPMPMNNQPMPINNQAPQYQPPQPPQPPLPLALQPQNTSVRDESNGKNFQVPQYQPALPPVIRM